MRTEGSSGGGDVRRLESVSATTRTLQWQREGGQRPGPLAAPCVWWRVRPHVRGGGLRPPGEDGRAGVTRPLGSTSPAPLSSPTSWGRPPHHASPGGVFFPPSVFLTSFFRNTNNKRLNTVKHGPHEHLFLARCSALVLRPGPFTRLTHTHACPWENAAWVSGCEKHTETPLVCAVRLVP